MKWESQKWKRLYYIMWSSNSLPIQINWFERETACLVFRTRSSQWDEVFFCWRFRSNEWYFKSVDWTWIKRREKQWVFKLALLKHRCRFSKGEMKWSRWSCWRWWYHPGGMRQKQHPMGNKLVSFLVQTISERFKTIPTCPLSPPQIRSVRTEEKEKKKNHLFRKMKFRRMNRIKWHSSEWLLFWQAFPFVRYEETLWIGKFFCEPMYRFSEKKIVSVCVDNVVRQRAHTYRGRSEFR